MNIATAELERLKKFAEMCFGGIPGLARALGKNKSVLYSYYSQESSPGKKLLTQIEEIGGNSEWIRRGVGSMFANNEAGKLLKERLGETETKISEPLLDYRIDMKNVDTQYIGRLIELIGISLQQHGKLLEDHERRIHALEEAMLESEQKNNL